VCVCVCVCVCVRERELSPSTWTLRSGLVEKGSGSNMRMERVERGKRSEREREKVNTRRSAMVIMKASTKLETPSLLISSRPHVRGLHPHAEDILTLEIQDSVQDYLPR